MEDIAALAGVALVTVSRVLNTPERVAPATRKKVEDAIRRTGYVQNLTAGALAGSRSRIVAAVVPTIANSIFADTVQGLTEALEASGYAILLGQTSYDAAREEALVRAMLGRRPDAVMLVGAPLSAATRRLLKSAGIPIVETWDMVERPIDRVVGFSNAEAGRLVAEHFVARGYRRMRGLGGAEARSRARLAGFAGALAAAGIVPQPTMVLASPGSPTGGRDAMRALIAQDLPDDALFFTTDIFAIGALLECQRRGIAVPGRIAIAGLGDLELAAQMVPALTTVRISGRAIGQAAAAQLLGAMTGKPSAQRRIDLGVELVARGTT
jgi:LacI family gluconate utilization system Gnt-I transcriptional repressor